MMAHRAGTATAVRTREKGVSMRALTVELPGDAKER